MPCLGNLYLHKQELQKKKRLQGSASVCLHSATTTLPNPSENTVNLEAKGPLKMLADLM